jgi:E1A-binding protein p400
LSVRFVAQEFSYWFSNPLTGMIEGNSGINNDLIGRLHGIMRPFLLRRLKKDVEKQLPGKFEHIVMCKLSRRQQFLYEEFMSRSSTRSLMQGGGFMGMMNVLMQLRKVCNHPDLFEPRPIISAFVLDRIEYRVNSILFTNESMTGLKRVSGDLLSLWHYDEDVLFDGSLSSRSVSRERFMSVMIDDVNIDKPHYLGTTREYDDFILAMRNMEIRARMEKREANFKIIERRSQRSRLSANWRLVECLTLPHSVVQNAFLARTEARARCVTPYCWLDLVKTEAERAVSMKDVLERFVFVRARAKADKIELVTNNVAMSNAVGHPLGSPLLEAKMRTVIADSLRPFYPAHIRQQIYFPDRKLVQFDSGKLQMLSTMLRELKQGGHKCLIFTQMSKMLDILEIFLNINGHTYVRLDGATTVDRRQKLMDRFNGDPKLFCFILSTRSGGFGINLTGADTVIFFDSDWNPAMDAQAQDRAHRIGQTREVHIYRLVCSSTVEENILIKAKQKRHLDYLVMTEGNFSEASLFNVDSVKGMLGIEESDASSTQNSKLPGVASADIDAAMAAAEDEEDIKAMRNAQDELRKEGDEFDENAPQGVAGEAPITELDDDDEGADKNAAADAESKVGTSSAPAGSESTQLAVAAKEDADMEAEFASWQSKIGTDFDSIQSALKPIERFAYKMHTEVEPFYSIPYLLDLQRMNELAEEKGGVTQEDEEWNVAEIERQKEENEERALNEGELLWAPMTYRDMRKMKHWYRRERERIHGAIRRRAITGEAWSQVVDVESGLPFWYNSDTGDASYTTPDIVVRQQNVEKAYREGYSALPSPALFSIFHCLTPVERMQAGASCSHWRSVAAGEEFHLKVFPVEVTSNRSFMEKSKSKDSKVFSTISEAIAAALPGDTIVLSHGHYWENDVTIAKPLRFVGDIEDPARCAVEITGTINVMENAKAVVFAGINVSRPRRLPNAKSLLRLQGRLVLNVSCNACIPYLPRTSIYGLYIVYQCVASCRCISAASTTMKGMGPVSSFANPAVFACMLAL